MGYETLTVDRRDGVLTVQLNRPEAGNAINAGLVADGPSGGAMRGATAVGSGADRFGGSLLLPAAISRRRPPPTCEDPESLYDLWLRLANGPFVSLAVARGRVNAGGVGLAAACDIVLADGTASFGLSEMLFGLFPACVLPFLIRRVGAQRAHYLTLTTQPVDAAQALAWGLVDAVEDPVEGLLRRHLVRLRRLGKPAIGRYKRHRAEAARQLAEAEPAALAANRALFNDPQIRADIRRYVTEMKFPWET